MASSIDDEWQGASEDRAQRAPLNMASASSSASSSLDYDPTRLDDTRVWRSRPAHRRRASQPVNNSILRQRMRSTPSGQMRGFSTPIYDEPSSSGDNFSSNSDSEDDDFAGRLRHRDNLEYLDLSISMPFALAALRDHLLAYAAQLEERMRALSPFPLAHSDAPSSLSDDHTLPSQSQSMPAAFYAHLEALKEELRAMIAALPSASVPFQDQGRRAGVALEAGRQSLASDWERLSKTLQTTLTMRPEFPITLTKSAHERAKALLASDLPLLHTITPNLSGLSLAAIWAPLASALPSSSSEGSAGQVILVSVQKRLEVLQEAVRAMTLRHLFLSAKTDERAGERDKRETTKESDSAITGRRNRSASFASVSQQALAKQFEAILDSIKVKGEEVRVAGHARASSMVKAAIEAEERMYAKAVELARNGQRLIRYEHLPELWRNNEHILSGYRFIPKEEWHSLLKSTFEIHNETGNIMTHLIGAAVVTPLFWPSKERFDDQTTPMDRMVQVIYLIAALKCLLLSVAWHVMAGCSDACLFERFACVDYTGIAWLVAASVWTLVYNAFYCQPNLAMVYSLSTFLVGLIGAIVPWQAWFNERQNKPIRIAVFLAMCFTGLAPFTHAILSHGVGKTVRFFGAIVPSLMAYIFGLVFYAFQMPERFYPGRFDVIGHAHQIWHISIVVAILLHFRATFFWHENRFNFSCAAKMPETSSHFVANPLALDLNLADEMVHGWRIIAGRVGDGLVGRIWDRCVDTLMSTF